MGRPKGEQAKITIELQATRKLVAYLDELKRIEGFGESRQEIVKSLVWAAIGRLILDKRLKQR
jgi:hypothetical protein